MNVVFLDTVGLIALWDESDQWHAEAEAAWQSLVAGRANFVTTTLILFECGNAAARRPYRDAVNQLRMALAKRNELISPTDEEVDQARQAYDRNDAAGAGIVDQVSILVMRRLGLTQAFTNDQHFEAAGFRTLF